MNIDLRSDTVTRPTKGMLDAMMNATVGDDVFGEDSTVNELEKKTAILFGKEAGLFCPSGTMTNQIAIKVHTEPGNEVICDKSAHIYNYEGGGIAFNSLCSAKLMNGDRGRYTADEVILNINPPNDHYPQTTLVSIENTSNRGGGSYYTYLQMKSISEVCINYNLKYHLDGARIFNALAETKNNTIEVGNLFDSISICLSKGLGTPAGSVLIGKKDFIKKARRIRKVLGGGMRQAGYLAAAGIYALDNHIDRLKEDNMRAKQLSEVIMNLSYVKDILPVDTNIIIFQLTDKYTADVFLEKLKNQHIIGIKFGPQTVRFVTHLDFNNEMLEKTIQVLQKM